MSKFNKQINADIVRLFECIHDLQGQIIGLTHAVNDGNLVTEYNRERLEVLENATKIPDTCEVYSDHLMSYKERLSFNLSCGDRIVYDEIYATLRKMSDCEVQHLISVCKMAASSNSDRLITK